MGAVFFSVLLAILFFSAMFFIILSTVLLIIWRGKKRRSEPVKKIWFVIPAVILVFNILVALIPVGFIAFLRFANNINTPEIVYAKSGIVLCWPMGEFESTTDWFEMDGTKYVLFPEVSSNEPFFLSPTEDKRGEPVANIKWNPADRDVFNEAMIFLLSGKTSDKTDVSTIYPLINKNSFEFFEVYGAAGGGVYCPESKYDSIKTYYTDIANYDTRNLSCEHSVYTNEEVCDKRHDSPYINVEQDVTAAPKVFEELSQTFDSQKGMMHVEIPQKYNKLDEAAKPGTPIFGYDERELSSYSKDKMAYRLIYLVLLDGQVYIEQESGDNYKNGYPLPDKMNQYIIDTVFVD